MTDEMQEQVERELSSGEKLRQKYGVKNSGELALRIARSRGFIATGCGSANKGVEYIAPRNSDSGLGRDYDDNKKNSWIANRILWSRGLTFGEENWPNGVVSDLGNRLRILDRLHNAEEGWLSGWKENRERRENDPRCTDGMSGWHQSYAHIILQRAHGFGKSFREGFDYSPEYFERLKNFHKKNPWEIPKNFRDLMNQAIANRFFEESVGTCNKVSKSEKRKLRDIYAEVNLGRSPAEINEGIRIRRAINNGIGHLLHYTKNGKLSECLELAGFGENKWSSRELTPRQWERYKRKHLNPKK
ncbi:hypothetical protein ACFL0X_00255 [Nanoarchaeota archaeon]